MAEVEGRGRRSANGREVKQNEGFYSMNSIDTRISVYSICGYALSVEREGGKMEKRKQLYQDKPKIVGYSG